MSGVEGNQQKRQAEAPRGVEWLTVVGGAASILSLVVLGGFVSAICFFVAGGMAWSRSFQERRAQGKPTVGNKARFLLGGLMVVLAVVMLPKPGETTAHDQAAVAAKDAPFSRSDALEPCEEAITPQLSHPSTADFDIGDTSFTEDEYGATFTIGLTAKNSFNLETKLRALCRFEGGKLVNAKVGEN